MTVMIFYTLQLILLLLLSYEDWRTKHISVVKLVAFTALTMGGLPYMNFPVAYQMVALIGGLLLFIKIGGLMVFQKSFLGNGDLILLIPLLASLHLTELPLFLISAGVMGMITAKIREERSVPFVPALSLSYGLTLVLRLF